MFKGEPGTRKSTQALSYPSPQYWVSTDRKMHSLILPMKRWGIRAQDIEFDDYVDWDKPRAKLESFRVNNKYKTIIVDSLTSLGDVMNTQTINNKRNSKDGGGKTIGGIYVPGIEEYNAEASAFNDLMFLLTDIHSYHKCHVILIAHVVGQRKADDKNNLTHHSRVIITGGDKISGKIASRMTEVYHFNVDSGFEMDADSDKYIAYTKHTGNDYARTSLPLPKKLEINNKPLYETFILPAQKALKAEKPVERIGASTTTNNITAPAKVDSSFSAT